MITLQESAENFAMAFAEFIKRLKEALERVVRKAWSFIVGHLPAIKKIASDYEKSEKCYRHNKHTRSTWKVNFDTRKRSQVMNNKPGIYIRKIIR